MTDQQIEKRQKELRRLIAARNSGDPIGCAKVMTQEEKEELMELQARSMVNSILAYNPELTSWDRVRWFYDEDEILGKERTDAVIASQVEFFRQHAIVIPDIYTDCEGLTYNSVKWN